MGTDTLNALVSDAIWRAEELEARKIPSASVAWAEVSSLEEELAKAHPVSESQGRIARRGAVRAALKARDYIRANALADEYIVEAPESLKAQLREILDEDAQAMASRFQFASRRYSMADAQGLALRFGKSGAFGMAA